MATNVRRILQSKGSPTIWSIAPTATVFEALCLLAEKDVGALPVLDGDRLVGIFSERDYARKVILKGRSSRDTKVYELMTQDVFYVHPDQTIEECMALMTNKRIRHLPVLDLETLVGIITIGDVVKAQIEDQELTIHSLENYIQSSEAPSVRKV